MKVQTFLVITAAIYIPFGFTMIFFPKFLYGLYGFDLGPGGKILGRVVGSAIVGMGLINLVSSTEHKYTIAMGAILLGNLMYHLIDVFIMLPPTLKGTVNAYAWSFVWLHIILAIGFLSFLLQH